MTSKHSTTGMRRFKAAQQAAAGHAPKRPRGPKREQVQAGKRNGDNFDGQYARAVQLAINCGCPPCLEFAVAAARQRRMGGRSTKQRRRKLLDKRKACERA